MNLNQVNLIGRLTKAPELRKTQAGQDVASFSMATNRTWTDKEGKKQEVAEFHNIVVWGKLAELVSKWLEKGQEAMVQGRLQTRSYEAKDGSKRYITEIVADNVQFGQKAGGSKKVSEKTQAPASEHAPDDDDANSEVSSEELPF